MSFRDFTPKSNPNTTTTTTTSANKNLQLPLQHPYQNATQSKKATLRRSASGNPAVVGRSSREQQQQQQQQQQRWDTLPLTRSRSDLMISYNNYHNGDTTTTTSTTTILPLNKNDNPKNEDHGKDSSSNCCLHLIQQREEEYALQVMQQREQELLDIHHKMHVVDEIYKDLGEIVCGQQQEMIDALEDQFERTEESTRRGLEQLEKANRKYDRRKQWQNQEGKTNKEGTTTTARDDDYDDDDLGNDSSGEKLNKKDQFFVLTYLSKKASQIAKLASVCGGSGSVDYVHGECCRNPP